MTRREELRQSACTGIETLTRDIRQVQDELFRGRYSTARRSWERVFRGSRNVYASLTRLHLEIAPKRKGQRVGK